jgi:hypothetical protein
MLGFIEFWPIFTEKIPFALDGGFLRPACLQLLCFFSRVPKAQIRSNTILD